MKPTKEENLEEILKAIAIVKELVLEDININDFYYSGDKDTQSEAFEGVMRSHDIIPSSTSEMDISDVERLWTQHKDEIDKEFDRLVHVGIETELFYKKVLDYLSFYEQ